MQNNMQSPSSSSTTNKNNHTRIPYKLNVFLFGREQEQSRSVKKFHKYTHKPIESGFSMDEESDDDDHLIPSGKICFVYVSVNVFTCFL
jgi:hypothetical protein